MWTGSPRAGAEGDPHSQAGEPAGPHHDGEEAGEKVNPLASRPGLLEPQPEACLLLRLTCPSCRGRKCSTLGQVELVADAKRLLRADLHLSFIHFHGH